MLTSGNSRLLYPSTCASDGAFPEESRVQSDTEPMDSADDGDVHGMRLLLVEDDPDSGPALKSMMERRGAAVSLAASGEQATAVFSAADFDAVVADIRLGGMSGVDLLAWVRERHASFPFVLLTGFDSLSSAIQAVRLGASDYILKPLDRVEDLLGPVARAVRHHRLSEQNRLLTQELQESRDQLRLLNARLLEVEESERRRIGADLHDRVAQDLAAIGMNLSMVAKTMGSDRARAEECLGRAKAMLGQAVGSVRDLMSELLPNVLENFGLGPALREHVLGVAKRSGMNVSVVGDVDDRLHSKVESALFRIAQEALANSVKHAQTDRATVSLEEQDGSITLTVQDAGAGFDVEACKTPGHDGGWGLALMAERVRSIGGYLEVQSSPGAGTRVSVQVRRQEV